MFSCADCERYEQGFEIEKAARMDVFRILDVWKKGSPIMSSFT